MRGDAARGVERKGVSKAGTDWGEAGDKREGAWCERAGGSGDSRIIASVYFGYLFELFAQITTCPVIWSHPISLRINTFPRMCSLSRSASH